MREQSFQRAKDLSELGIDIELFSMNKSSNSPFDATLFYKNIISFSEEDEHLGCFFIKFLFTIFFLLIIYFIYYNIYFNI